MPIRPSSLFVRPKDVLKIGFHSFKLETAENVKKYLKTTDYSHDLPSTSRLSEGVAIRGSREMY
jgi:hypothetical protein